LEEQIHFFPFIIPLVDFSATVKFIYVNRQNID
jgi:hypothetical protein